MASPISAVASAVAGRKWESSSPAAARIAFSMSWDERSRSGCVAKSEVGATFRLITVVVRPLDMRERPSAPAVTTMSQPRTRSAAPGAMRVA